MTGNVWEWAADWFVPTSTRAIDAPTRTVRAAARTA